MYIDIAMLNPGQCTNSVVRFPLTKLIVTTRGKCSDHHLCEKLNIVDYNINHISLCLEMRHLEDLSLSVNRIFSLSSLGNCFRLKKLFLCDNKIKNLDELTALKNAAELTHLGMRGNPCSIAAGSEYRPMVLRLLPQIKNLDQIEVSEEELQAALHHQVFEVNSHAPSLNEGELVSRSLTVAMARRSGSDRKHESVNVSCQSGMSPTCESPQPLGTQSPAPRMRYTSVPPRMSQSLRALSSPDIYLDSPLTQEELQSMNAFRAILNIVPYMDISGLLELLYAAINLIIQRDMADQN